ncbi:hypothetical protein BGZ75_010291 [Mortierella antarctica]|nr:hypothetical protein BGZ75_010291 [Mortierella antarctica]
MSIPRVILGTMTFALESSQDGPTPVRVRGSESVKVFLDNFHAHGHSELDTARIYCSGDTETVLGQLPMDRFKIATKVWPTHPGAHAAKSLKATFRKSLKALKTKVDIFYLHAPDYTTTFEETIKAVDELYRDGLFERFGLSNFAAWQVTLIHQLCKHNGYVLPTVYQGMYNAINREVTKELFPCLKELNISFYGFNPIAGGILSGKHKFEDDEGHGGSFDSNTLAGKAYRERYWNGLVFEAVDTLNKTASENNLTLVGASLRWMRYHSGLDAKDGIIIGASSLRHLEDNLKDLAKGPLPQAMVDAFDRAWEKVRATSPSYFRADQVFLED